jgi:hypothetical protein
MPGTSATGRIARATAMKNTTKNKPSTTRTGGGAASRIIIRKLLLVLVVVGIGPKSSLEGDYLRVRKGLKMPVLVVKLSMVAVPLHHDSWLGFDWLRRLRRLFNREI